MKIKILESAKADLLEGYRFYESKAEGIGAYFLQSIFADIDALKLFAGIHLVCFNEYHRTLSKRFPFAIYYRIENNEIRIYAILDCRRDPAWVRERFK